MTEKKPLLSIVNLSVNFSGKSAIQDVSFHIHSGETIAIIGESGSGKSVTALSILQLLPYPTATHPTGSIRFCGQELMGLKESALNKIRGKKIAMIFQEPMSSLNPLHTVERQLKEAFLLHQGVYDYSQMVELLKLVQLNNPEGKAASYPHQLSGGERQRVMIAMALAGKPELLIADEPTTALDVTTQAEILTLIKDLQKRFNMALLLITHDLSVARKMARTVIVMKDGHVIESGDVEKVFTNPSQPYTQHLMACEPTCKKTKLDNNAPVILQVRDLSVRFPIKTGLFRRITGYTHAVDGVSFTLAKGETLGIVGESGSGKTTLALAILRLISSQGTIELEGKSIGALSQSVMRQLRKRMQIVFQDPFASLSPRMTVEQIVEEGLAIHAPLLTREDRRVKVLEALHAVGLDHSLKDRYPHALSGGQRQRVSIARALILDPALLILDEPTSALDRSIQADVLTLLATLQRQRHLSYIFISHDLKSVQALSHHVIVLRGGKVVESGTSEALFNAPQHPYTQDLLHAAYNIFPA